MDIANRHSVEMGADLQETDLNRDHVGDDAYILLDAVPEKRLPGKIIRIGSEINPENGTVDVRVVFNTQPLEAASIRLLPVMTADVNLVTGRLKNKMIGPAVSVEQDNGKFYVYRFRDGEIQRQQVTA